MEISIVTGASSGIGREFVKQLSTLNPLRPIWVIARREERLLELQKEVAAPLRIFACDLTKQEEIESIEKTLVAESPNVVMLVNCSGFAKFGNYETIGIEDSLSMIDLNVRALVYMTTLCIPHMKSGGRIIQVASTAAFQPLPGMNVYAASKAFVLSYSRTLARELGEGGIGVTAVCPGWTKTEFFDVAEKNADSGAVQNFFFPSLPEHVAARAIKDSYKGREISIYGIFNKFHWFFAKILPTNSVMTFWDIMK